MRRDRSGRPRPAVVLLLVGTLACGARGLVPAVARAGDDPFPYDTDTSREVGLFGAGAALLTAGLLIDASREALTADQVAALDRADVNAFDRPATYRWSPDAARASDILVTVAMVAPLSLAVTEPGSRDAGTLVTMYGETVLLNAGLVSTLKGLFGRVRPYAYNDDPDIGMDLRTGNSAVRSFPSGHTADAFAAAVFTSTVYGRMHPDGDGRTWVWAGSLTVATAVGVLRYAAGRHFPTDIIAGAAVGSLVGWAVPELHRNDPADGGDAAGKGFSLSYGFRF